MHGEERLTVFRTHLRTARQARETGYEPDERQHGCPSRDNRLRARARERRETTGYKAREIGERHQITTTGYETVFRTHLRFFVLSVGQRLKLNYQVDFDPDSSMF